MNGGKIYVERVTTSRATSILWEARRLFTRDWIEVLDFRLVDSAMMDEK